MKLRPREMLRDDQHLIAGIMKRETAKLIVAPMGRGKSGATLTALVDMLADRTIRRVLIIAPLRVAKDTWPDEIETWEHTRHLTYAVCVGAPEERRDAIAARAQITIINRENVVWLLQHLREFYKNQWPYDCVVIDESTMFAEGEKRTKKTKTKTVSADIAEIEYGQPYEFKDQGRLLSAVRIGTDDRVEFDDTFEGFIFKDDWQDLLVSEKVQLNFQKTNVRPGGNVTRFGVMALARKHIKRIYELTGTPGDLEGLWGQIYLLDQGQRLYADKKAFMARWFETNPYSRKTKPFDHSEGEVMAKISDLMVSLPKLDLVPKPVFTDIRVDLSPAAHAEYNRFERTLVSQVHDVEAVNSGVLVNKLLQFANGSMYREDQTIAQIHTEKLDALDELIARAAGDPVLVFYGFKFDLAQIKKRHPDAVVLNESDTAVKDWNVGKIKILLAHPASCAHGLNLQYGGHIAIWYGLTWSLELYLQANARLPRPGQTEIVSIYRIIANGTADETVLDVLEEKEASQDRITDAVLWRITGEGDTTQSECTFLDNLFK